MDLMNGWFTYDNDSVFSHVWMPRGLSVSLAFRDSATGALLTQALIGRKGEREETLHPGHRSWDGGYTDMEMEFRGNRVRVESTAREDKLLLTVTPVSWRTAPMTLLVSAAMLWNRPGTVSYQDGHTLLCRVDGRKVLVKARGEAVREMHTGLRGPYLALRLDQPVTIGAGQEPPAPETARTLLDAAAEKLRREAAAYGDQAECYSALRACMGWDTIFEPEKQQLCTPVSRIWNIQWGGYVLFCWDTFFSAAMAALGPRELAYANVRAILGEITEKGFVPNFGAAGDNKSRDRSQPPVGSMTVLQLYERFGDVDFVASVFDRLLEWNRWLASRRMVEDGTLCWGTDPYDPVKGREWESHPPQETFYAALESGLDNSPMYDDIPFDRERSIMQLSDVGLTGLYIADCESLAKLARILGREEEAELICRTERAKDGMQTLWNEELGIHCNRRRDTGEFSTRLAPTMFYALFSDRVTPGQRERILREHFYNTQEFMGEYILPSTPRNDPAYPEQIYWRGRIWAPLNYLVYLAFTAQGLKAECDLLARKSRELLLKEWLEHGHVHENYNADTAEGCDSHRSDSFYHWGALLALIAIDNAQK